MNNDLPLELLEIRTLYGLFEKFKYFLIIDRYSVVEHYVKTTLYDSKGIIIKHFMFDLGRPFTDEEICVFIREHLSALRISLNETTCFVPKSAASLYHCLQHNQIYSYEVVYMRNWEKFFQYKLYNDELGDSAFQPTV